MNRVVIIGLDGAPYEFVINLIKQGLLPNLGKVARDGVFAPMRSTIPPMTCPAWPSMVTGLNPGKHGLFDFINRRGRHVKIASSLELRGKAIWDHLTSHGLTSIVVNVPVTYPPYQINGVMISGMLTPEGAGWIWPPDLEKEINQRVKGYIVYFDHRPHRNDPDLVSRRLLDSDKKRYSAFEYLLSTYDWSFAMVVFNATDQIGHLYWHDDVVTRVYIEIDRLVGRFLDTFRNLNLFIVSDHGMVGVEKYVLFNQILYEHGFIRKKLGYRRKRIEVLKGGKGHLSLFGRIIIKSGLTPELIDQFIDEFHLRKLVMALPRKFRNAFLYNPYIVDYGRSRAFACHFTSGENVGVYLNVPESQREDCIDKVSEIFLNLKDPENGVRPVDSIYRREDLYNGPFVEMAPDIFIMLKEGYSKRAYFGDAFIEKRRPRANRGVHSRIGIFMASGPDIRRLGVMSERSIVDVAPTILYALDIPIPSDVDGKPLTRIFTHKREPRYADLAEKTAMRIEELKRLGAV